MDKKIILKRLIRGTKKIPSTGKGIPDRYVFTSGKIKNLAEYIKRLLESIKILESKIDKEY